MSDDRAVIGSAVGLTSNAQTVAAIDRELVARNGKPHDEDNPHGDVPTPTDADAPEDGTDPLTILERRSADLDEHRTVPPPPAAAELGRCIDVYRRWLHLTDAHQVVAALGAVAANLLPGDPLWLLFVGAPGSGKTETIHPFAALPYVHPAATFTEAALLSGVAKKEHEAGATGGLLRQVGAFGVILAKDFSGVLSMNRDARAQVLAALREVYDGAWYRPVGTGGGKVLSWSGKAGLVGAVTPSIDRHHAVMGALGERFVFFRLTIDDPRAQARRRLGNRGQERRMRDELSQAVAAVLALVDPETAPRSLSDGEVDRLVDLAAFVVTARTAVERDGYDREVVVMPSAEAPGRLVGALGAFLAGIEAIGADAPTAWTIVTKAAWDCIPDMRRRLLQALHTRDAARTSDLTTATSIPRTSAERTLEDLALLGLLEGTKAGDHDTAAWTWALSAEASSTWPNGSPEVFKVGVHL
jgi:hypothetical protein